MRETEVRLTDPRAFGGTLRERAGAYLALTKPRIIELLLTTTVPAMVVAADGWPGWWLVAATMIGGTLSAGGANSINNVIDRDIDEKMRRTSRRPLPTRKVEPRRAAVFGVALGVAGFVWLWTIVNLMAGLLATAALLFYVVIYTLVLKRTTPQNIVIGGAAGAVPVLVGWAAVTGSLGLAPWIMFAIVFYWTPPHFWALALRYQNDYGAAGVPMLPVVAGTAATTRQIFLYTLMVGAASLLLFAVAPMGYLYLAGAVVLGAGLVWEGARLRRHPERAMQMFRFSNIYLATLFVLMAVDRLVG